MGWDFPLNNITVILLLSFCSIASATTHTVTRVTSSPYGIEQSLLAIGSGAAFTKTVTIEDLISSDTKRMVANANPTIWLDGERVELWGLIGVTHRLRQFLDDSEFHEGSIEYVYYLRYGNSNVTRSTRLTDGRLVLTTTIRGGMNPVDWARLTIVAVEHAHGTAITGTLTAHTHIGDRCRLVNRIAHRRMHGPMAGVLQRVESGARELGRAGAPDLLGIGVLFVKEMTRGR